MPEEIYDSHIVIEDEQTGEVLVCEPINKED